MAVILLIEIQSQIVYNNKDYIKEGQFMQTY